MTIGERIKERRSKLGLSQANLASSVETDSASVSRWERDKVSVSQKYILKLAKALNTTSDYLLGKTDDPELGINTSEIKAKNGLMNSSEFMERLIKNQPMVVYETDTERMLIPATLEGFNFIREMRGAKTTGSLAVAR